MHIFLVNTTYCPVYGLCDKRIGMTPVWNPPIPGNI